MTSDMAGGLIWVVGVLAMFFLLLVARKGRAKGGSFTAAVAGTLHDLHSQDKRRAIEIVLQERAAQTDPETADGKGPYLVQERNDSKREGSKP